MSKMDIQVEAADGHVVHATHREAASPRGVVLLVHGITADRTEWGFYDILGSALQARGVASLAIDYRGHGKSALPPNRLTLSGITLDIEASWAFLMSRYPTSQTKRFISGNSLGGGLSYFFGLRSQTVDHVILTMPVLSYIDDLTRVNGNWKLESDAGREISYAHLGLSPLLPAEMYLFDELIAESHDSKPVTILHGLSDTDVPFEESRKFCEARASCRLVGLKGMDHCWAAPGDPMRETPASKENQQVASRKYVDLLEMALDD